MVQGEGETAMNSWCCLVTKSCSTLFDPIDCSPPGSSVHGISQARTLEGVAIPFSSGSSQCKSNLRLPCIAGRLFTAESPGKPLSGCFRRISESLLFLLSVPPPLFLFSPRLCYGVGKATSIQMPVMVLAFSYVRGRLI